MCDVLRYLGYPTTGDGDPVRWRAWRGPTAAPPLCRQRGEGRGDRWERVVAVDAFLDACRMALMRLARSLRWVALAKGRGGGSVRGL